MPDSVYSPRALYIRTLRLHRRTAYLGDLALVAQRHSEAVRFEHAEVSGRIALTLLDRWRNTPSWLRVVHLPEDGGESA